MMAKLWRGSTNHKLVVIYPPSRQKALDAALAAVAHS